MSIEIKGLSSANVLEFYKACDGINGENHGMLITRDGKTLFENYVFPYSADMPHTLFSVTKSLVSTAVGFAIDEGLISLDTKVYGYFTDYIQSKGTEKITVRDLLTMNSGKKFSFLQNMTGDYVEIFMKSGFRNEGGFLYSNNDVHVLSALLQRITGKPVVDYLVPRLFDPLGIPKPEWETDCKGICVGGTGAYLSLRSLVKIVQCYLDGGKYKGKQVIPEFWTKEATKTQIDFEHTNPAERGYGYLFWIRDGSFSMNGLYGQIVSGYPELNAVIGFTGCVINDSALPDISEKHLVTALGKESTPEDDKCLEDYLSSKDEKIRTSTERNTVPEGVFKIDEKSKAITGLFFPASLIPRSISSSMAKRPTSSFDLFTFKQENDEITIKWFEESDAVTVKCGLNGVPGLSECSIKGYKYIIWSYGWWEGNVLNVRVKPINTLSSLSMAFRFEDDFFTLKLEDTPSFREFILGNMNQVAILTKTDAIKSVSSKVMNTVLKTAEAGIKFKKVSYT